MNLLNKSNVYKAIKGFTLVELLIVLAIIGVMAGVIFVNYDSAREQSRDDRRASDLAQIEVVLRLYAEQYGPNINCNGGLKIDGNTTVSSLPSSGSCPDGARILSFLASTLKTIPYDPRGPANNDYYYYFDGDHQCASSPTGTTTMVFAANLESLASNVTTVCGSAANNDGGYLNTTSYSGSINPSRPRVERIDFMN
jgi:prepilin-type N-terminal cleavage/methylation domain-containing protein